jgi:transcription elongation factor Elf1
LTNADVDNIDFDLIHRSNSLTSSHGASSPTSIMGKEHEICRSSPTAEITLSSSKLRTGPDRNVLKLTDTNLDGAGSDSSVPTVSPRQRETVSTDDDCVRVKRKMGSDGGSDDSSISSLIPTACAPPAGAITSQTVVSDQESAQVSRSISPLKLLPQQSTAEGETNGWDRSIEELECGQKDEYISSRRRRRLNLIVPNPRKPRTADYMCSMCNEMYQVVVGDNPWWAVYSQQCPLCKQQQVPRIDINSASNAIELDPNVMALYGEGVEDSGDEECEGGSEDEEDAEKDEDDEAAAAAAAEADQDDLRSDVHPFDGEGLLAAEEASKLLVLMCHARSCTGLHASPKHAEICKVRKSSARDVTASHLQFDSLTHTLPKS